jgi:AAA family ATP:ADP antiporter
MLLVLRWHRHHGENTARGVDRDERLGGTALAAFRQVVQSPYLALIALFVLLLTWASTFLYLEQQAMVETTFASRDARTEFFSTIDSAQAIALMQLFVLGACSAGSAAR